jgi:hypothetical protein
MLLTPAPTKSGFRYIRFFAGAARPYAAAYAGRVSKRVGTLDEASALLAAYMAHERTLVLPTRTRSQAVAAPRPAQSAGVKKKKKRQLPAGKTTGKRTTGKTTGKTTTGKSTDQTVVEETAPAPATADDWMTKANVVASSFDPSPYQLFGARIRMKRRDTRWRPDRNEWVDSKEWEMAVVKSYQPCTSAPYVVVFDERPNNAYNYDLLRHAEWERVDWEGDVLSTAALRPVCPSCGLALGVGPAAWTFCRGCGMPEPGAISTGITTRQRGCQDPYRKSQQGYTEVDEDEEEEDNDAC